MKKNIWIYGLILGAIICFNMVYMVNLCYNRGDFSGSDVVGYAAMIILFSFIFIAVRNYRNKNNGGVISFGSAFKMGSLIVLVASTMYVTVWLFYYYLFVPDFIDVYIPHVLKEATASGATQVELDNKIAEMEKFKQMYKNPLFVILVTYAEIAPVGLVVALISALILKKKPVNMDLAAS